MSDPFFGVYSVVVCTYILSRFAFSLATAGPGGGALEPASRS